MYQRPIRTIIVDDEVLARKLVKKFLLSFPEIIVVDECDNGLSAIEKINSQKPDLIFLDIQMPELDGLGVLNEIQCNPQIIFTTAYNQYAIRAFDLNAVDYLLKPFDQSRFNSAIAKVRPKFSLTEFKDHVLMLQNSINKMMAADKKYLSRLLIKGKESYQFVELKDVLWFEAYSDYVKIHTKEKYFLKNISLNELDTILDPEHFVRIHRSTIVNIDCVTELIPYFNGEYFIVISNGEKLKLSRSYKEKIKGFFDESI